MSALFFFSFLLTSFFCFASQAPELELSQPPIVQTAWSGTESSHSASQPNSNNVLNVFIAEPTPKSASRNTSAQLNSTSSSTPNLANAEKKEQIGSTVGHSVGMEVKKEKEARACKIGPVVRTSTAMWICMGSVLVGAIIAVLVLDPKIKEGEKAIARLNLAPGLGNSTENCFSVNVQTEDGLSQFSCASNSSEIGEVYNSFKPVCSKPNCLISAVLFAECDENILTRRCETGARYWANLRNEQSVSKARNKNQKTNNRLRNSGR